MRQMEYGKKTTEYTNKQKNWNLPKIVLQKKLDY